MIEEDDRNFREEHSDSSNYLDVVEDLQLSRRQIAIGWGSQSLCCGLLSGRRGDQVLTLVKRL